MKKREFSSRVRRTTKYTLWAIIARDLRTNALSSFMTYQDRRYHEGEAHTEADSMKQFIQSKDPNKEYTVVRL